MQGLTLTTHSHSPPRSDRSCRLGVSAGYIIIVAARVPAPNLLPRAVDTGLGASRAAVGAQGQPAVPPVEERRVLNRHPKASQTSESDGGSSGSVESGTAHSRAAACATVSPGASRPGITRCDRHID